jgi:cardiolipin synthase
MGPRFNNSGGLAMELSTGRRQHNGAFRAGLAAAAGLALVAALSACASPKPDDGGIAARAPEPNTVVATRDVYLVPAGVDASGYGAFSRRVNGTTGLLGIMLKTYTTDPLLRPLSTVRSLGFLISNSLADLARQTVISMVQLPQVTSTPIPPISGGPGMNLEEWEQDLDRITQSKSSTGTLEFLIDGNEYFPALIKSIEGANKSIHLRTYIFDNDDYAIHVADLLKQRSHEVDVKVSMDGIGTLTGGLVASSSMPASFEPPASIANYLRTDSDIRVRTLTNPWFSGDHTKVTIVDRDVAFLGGMNIGREYRYDWHDLMVRLEGAVVDDLARDSDDAWEKSGMLGDVAAFLNYFAEPESSPSRDGYPLRVLVTRAQHSQIYTAQLAAIRRAQKYIYIENPYFSDDAILFELIAARRRGVDVRFVIAEKGDAMLMDMSNVQAINTMLDNGIRVYMYPEMTHVKAAIVDDWAMVGSANLDKLSLRVNNELNIATSHPETVNVLKERLFEADFEKSTELRKRLPAGPKYRLAEAVADFFL